MKIRILGKNPWRPSRRIGSDAALFACGRKRPTNGNGKLVRPVSEARYGERCEHGRTAGFRNGKGIGVRNAVFRAPQSLGSSKIPGHPRIRVAQSFKSPNASGRLMLRDVQCFGSFKASGRSRLQVTQGFEPLKASGHPRLRTIQSFRSPKASDRPKLQVIKGFRSSKTSGHQRLQVSQDFRSPKTSDRPNLRVPSFAHEK